MKRLVVAVAVMGATAGFATPAQAAPLATVGLWTNWQPATVVVNDKVVVVNDIYNDTYTEMEQGQVTLSVQRKVDIGGRNCGYFDSFADGYRSPERTIELGAGGASFSIYYRSGAC